MHRREKRPIQNPPGETAATVLPRPLADAAAWVEQASPYLIDAVTALQEARSRRDITCFYITGSFANGRLKDPPRDIDFVVSPASRFSRTPNPPEIEELRERLNDISKSAGTTFELKQMPFGRVYRVGTDGILQPTGEIRGQDVLDRVPPETAREKVLIDLSAAPYQNPGFFTRLYKNILAGKTQR
ncbi:MAG: hypothetical protein PHG85_06990 [Candidatus Altiarchaeota archaeon]|nr:hypothetical protein [Candidatus Altiarchaeota archaeon]